MVLHKVRQIAEPAGTYPFRRELEHFLRKRAMVLHERVAAVDIIFSETQKTSETTRYFWNEYSPHLVYRNPEIQILKTTPRFATPSIRVVFEHRDPVLIPGCINQDSAKPITTLVSQFMEIAGANEMELERKIKGERSWGGEDVECICDVRGQCPCPKKVKLPENIYTRNADHGPRDSFGRVVSEDKLPPEVSTWMFSPAARDKRYMTYNEEKKY